MIYKILELNVVNNLTAESIGTTNLKLRVKDTGANYLVHKVLTIQQSNNRQFTASTKTRSEVSGGGRKPWKQKGTGRARAGSNRSPLWRGGGVTFGPRPKTIKLKVNKKEKFLALQTLLLNKKEKILAIDEINMEDFRTKNVNDLIKKMNLSPNQKILFVTKVICPNLRTATRNMPLIKLISIDQIDIQKILDADSIIFDLEAIKHFDAKIHAYY